MSLAAPLSPREVLAQVAAALPAESREQLIIIGSLAAGYHFFADEGGKAIRTKDVDCMFTPQAKAVAAAESVTEQLLEAHWKPRPGGPWGEPGAVGQAAETLPLVRLQPPSGADWFIELLGAPEAYAPGAPMKRFHALETRAGRYALCSFGFLGLAEWQPLPTPFGLRIARPEMMALANLLHHAHIGPDTIAGSLWKRSNKDLGRVLALAHLAVARDRQRGEDDFSDWASRMAAALHARFPGQARPLAQRSGQGLRALLASSTDFDEALAISNLSLLASMEVSRAGYAATGRRLLAEVIEPLEEGV